MSKFIIIVLLAYLTISKGEPYTGWHEEAGRYESEITYNKLVVTWPSKISTGYFNIPENLSLAMSEGWTEIDGASPSPHIKALGNKGDPRYIVKYLIQSGLIVGFQISFPCKDVGNVPLDYANHIGITKRRMNGEYYYTASVLIIENPKGDFQLWVEYNATQYERIPILAERIPSETRLLKKKCIPTMADPHYYAINATTSCSNIYPWAALARGKDIVGIVFQAIGTATADPARTWYEDLPVEQLKKTIPDGPPCLIDLFKKYGVISIHTWFIKDPWNIECSEKNLPPSSGESSSSDKTHSSGELWSSGESPSSGKPSSSGGHPSSGEPSYSGEPSSSGKPSSSGGHPSSGEPSYSGEPSSSGKPSSSGGHPSSGEPSYSGEPSSSGKPSSSGGQSSSSKPSTSGKPSSHGEQSSSGESSSSDKPSSSGKPASSGKPSSNESTYKSCHRTSNYRILS